MNATFAWIADNLAEDIDFVVWTGDSARHDNDDRIPRNASQVLSQNEFLIEKFREVWGADGAAGRNGEFKIPIVPTFGNNDILPHNIFSPGPNRWTHAYLSLWKRLIPESQRHSFARGGWFYVEAIPNRLAVFSLNTMYFFANNAAVDGCDDKSEPGYEQLEWLRIQLELLRQRGVKAILTGHVPPARNGQKEMWTESCWMKYALWLRQYRDVVVGSLWGHMNIEHFFLQDFEDIVWDTETDALLDVDGETAERDPSSLVDQLASPVELRRRDEPTVNIEVKNPDYLNALREQWSALPSTPSSTAKPTKKKKFGKSPEERYQEAIGGQHAERYAVSFVSASVVPNFYPTLRIFNYNTTGLKGATIGTAQDMDRRGRTNQALQNQETTWNDIDVEMQLLDAQSSEDMESDVPLRQLSDSVEPEKKQKKKKHHKKKKGKKHKPTFPVPQAPAKSAPPGPAYSQQPLSWLGYRQLFANLTHIQRDLSSETIGDAAGEISDKDKLRAFKFETEYDTTNEQDVYDLAPNEAAPHAGITVKAMLDLASRIGSFKPSKNDLLEDEASTDLPNEDSDSDSEAEQQSDNESDDEYEDEDADVETEKEKKHKKGKHGKKKRRKIINKTWFAFVDRALVGTVPADQLHRDYGQVDPHQ